MNAENKNKGYSEKLREKMMEKKLEKKSDKSIKKKLEYFWDYDKWYVIIPLLLLMFVIFTVRGFLQENRKASVYISMINCKDEYSVDEYLTAYSDLLQKQGRTKEAFRLEGGLIQPEVVDEKAAADTMVTASIQRYQAEVISKRSQAVIASDWVIRDYGAADAYCDLRDVLTPEQLEQLQDDLFICKNMEGKEIAAGVYLKSKIFEDAYNGNAPVFAIASYLEDKTVAVEFLLYCAGEAE